MSVTKKKRTSKTSSGKHGGGDGGPRRVKLTTLQKLLHGRPTGIAPFGTLNQGPSK